VLLPAAGINTVADTIRFVTRHNPASFKRVLLWQEVVYDTALISIHFHTYTWDFLKVAAVDAVVGDGEHCDGSASCCCSCATGRLLGVLVEVIHGILGPGYVEGSKDVDQPRINPQRWDGSACIRTHQERA
jgi:hypothetical protein